MESMADAQPRFLLELLVAHLSDLQQKQQSRICVHMAPNSSTDHDHGVHKNSIDAHIDQRFEQKRRIRV